MPVPKARRAGTPQALLVELRNDLMIAACEHAFKIINSEPRMALVSRWAKRVKVIVSCRQNII